MSSKQELKIHANQEAREREVKAAIRVILSDTDSYSKSLNYAVNYCKAVFSQEMSGYELKVQCLYILSNISHWRHPEAKRVREVLKKFSK